MSDGPFEAVYVISVAAELAGMHPQTLREYERKGLVSPRRTKGNTRRYSQEDIQRLRDIQHLTQQEGVNLAGVAIILDLRRQLVDATRRVAEVEGDLAAAMADGRAAVASVHRTYRKDLVPYAPPAKLVRKRSS